MKKLIKVVIVLLIFALIGAIGLFFSINSAVEEGVRMVVPTVTKTEGDLEKAQISIFSGEGDLTNFIVKNPKGFDSAHAVNVGTIRVKLDPMSVFSEKIVIDEIFIDGAEVNYEVALNGTNIGTIQKNIDEFAEKQKAEAKSEGEETLTTEKFIKIKKFTFQNPKITLLATHLKGQELTLELPNPVTLKDIGGEEGISVAQAAKVIANPVTSAIEMVVNAKDQLLKDPLKGAEALLKGAGQLEGGIKKNADSLLKKLGGE